jgi:hypothetical protein
LNERLPLLRPTSWADLAKPEYKGMIAMPNPASSGTGLLDVLSWLQVMGEEKGWEFMDALHQTSDGYGSDTQRSVQARCGSHCAYQLPATCSCRRNAELLVRRRLWFELRAACSGPRSVTLNHFDTNPVILKRQQALM